jgi:hypothetical protein
MFVFSRTWRKSAPILDVGGEMGYFGLAIQPAIHTCKTGVNGLFNPL